MKIKRKPVAILLAEDDDDDYKLTRDALQEARILNELHRVIDGEELMDYLHHRNAFSDAKSSPVPGLIVRRFGYDSTHGGKKGLHLLLV